MKVRDELNGLRSLESLLVIVGSILILGMSYGIFIQSISVIIIITGATLVTSTMYINGMNKEEFAYFINKDIGLYDRFMNIGPIVGPVRMFLALCILMTLITFNLFAWQIYLISYFYVALIIHSREKQLGLNS